MAQRLPTFFQTSPDYVWLFDGNGVRCIDSRINWVNISGITRTDSHWALVDSNRGVADPAAVLYSHRSPFFIVQAASPRETQFGWTKYHGPLRRFYTKPFSLEEIFVGA